jgi:hypothetical protein
MAKMSLAEWAEGLASGEIELFEKLVKKGFEPSYGMVLVSECHPTKNGKRNAQNISTGSSNKVWWKCSNPSCVSPGGYDWETPPSDRTRTGNGCPACSGRVAVPGVNDMVTTHPELAAEWHPTKNGDRKPQDVKAGTQTKIWWKCSDSSCVVPGGHEWETPGSNRSHGGSGCPVCAGKAVAPGFNDMATTHPELAAEFDLTKNGDLTPQAVVAGTNKNIWWKHSDPSCVVPGGHEWQAKGNSRAGRGTGCPACSNKTLVVGANDMATIYPDLAADWHPTKNGDLTPQDVGAGSNKKFWWKHADSDCVVPGGCEWQATRHRGSGCPACAGNITVPGVNDLATTHPNLAADWHPTKNGDTTAQNIKHGSKKMIWWKHSDPGCVIPGGYEWECDPGRRSLKDSGCPACKAESGGKSLVVGINDLATLNPELAAEWHPTKNGTLTPQSVKAGSQKKIWWKCSDQACPDSGGHEWQAFLDNRNRYGHGCPACSGRKAISGFNDLATANPGLATYWHPVKNGHLTPQDITSGSNKSVWWKHSDPSCVIPGGHEWESTVNSKSRNEATQCPACAGRDIVPGVNDLTTTHPELADDWHTTKNGDLDPRTIHAGINKTVWWKHSDPKCVVPGGHEWQASGNGRANGGTGCPACNRGWGLDAVRKFIITMVEYGHIGSLSQAEMYTLAQQNGLMQSNRVGAAIANLASGKSITSFAGDQLKTISEEADMNVHDLVNDMSDLDIAQANPEAFADFVLADVEGATFDDPETDDEPALVDDADVAAVVNDGDQVDTFGGDMSAGALPGQVVDQALRTADVLFAAVDEEMVEYFIAARLHTMWAEAYKDPAAARAAAEAFRG